MNQLIICGHAVKTLESKETEAQGNDGNAQFSLCCCTSTMPDDDCKIDIRHSLCLIALVIPSEVEESLADQKKTFFQKASHGT